MEKDKAFILLSLSTACQTFSKMEMFGSVHFFVFSLFCFVFVLPFIVHDLYSKMENALYDLWKIERNQMQLLLELEEPIRPFGLDISSTIL